MGCFMDHIDNFLGKYKRRVRGKHIPGNRLSLPV